MLINLLVYLLIGVVVVAVVFYILGLLIADPKLLKIAKVIVAVIALIYLIWLFTGNVGTSGPVLIFRR